jgi:hypothetical protein
MDRPIRQAGESATLSEIITSRSIPEPNTGCWLWTGTLGLDGYGKIKRAGKTYRAHRLSYELFCDAPGEMLVMHKCDTPLCVNPDHLSLGTPADNMEDKVAKGRQAKGERAGPRALTPKLIAEIKAAYVPRKVSQRALAERFGVAEITIHRMLKARTWKHLT